MFWKDVSKSWKHFCWMAAKRCFQIVLEGIPRLYVELDLKHFFGMPSKSLWQNCWIAARRKSGSVFESLWCITVQLRQRQISEKCYGYFKELF